MYKLDFLFLVENANLRGGTEIQTINITHALIEANYRARVLSVVPYSGGDDVILSFDLKSYRMYEKQKKNPINDLCAERFSDACLAKLLRVFIATCQPKVLVNETYELITALPFGGQCRIVQVFNWSVLGYEESILQIIHQKHGWMRFLSMKKNVRQVTKRHAAIALCNDLIVLTNTAKKELKMVNHKIKETRIRVIANPLRKSDDAKNISSLDNRNIVFVGRLSFEKGVMRLLHIWQSISRQFHDYTLSVYGEGDAKDQMEQYIQENGMKNIRFCGFEQDLSKIYLSADLLLSTSESEGFGLVFIEAFYYGVPVVSFNCPVSPKEVIADAGVLIDCFDEQAYATHVMTLLHNKEKLRMLQRKAVERARCFYQSRIVSQWVKLVE